MSTETTDTLYGQRERALRRARRRLRWLEIETHRIKAQLARLEAAFEDDVADRLSEGRRRLRPRRERLRFDPRHNRSAAGSFELVEATHKSAEWTRISESPLGAMQDCALPVPNGSDAIQGLVDISNAAPFARRPAMRQRVRQSRPFLLSLAFHVLAVCIMLPWTIATIVKQQPQLMFSSPVEWDSESGADLVDVEFTAVALDDELSAEMTIEPPTANVAEQALADVFPAETSPIDVAGVGLSEAAVFGPAEIGALHSSGESGARGGDGKGTRGNALGSSTFFGTKSQGDRFVFIVDNSSSMKEGRLEAALAELVRSIEALDRRQAFYVIFVADQVYPMFFPDRASELALATPENKKRLAAWLGKVQRAGGNNRELIKAMDLAAEMRPHAVFLLWDGDLRYSEAVRRDVMTHFTRPQPWEFAIHTLGMGTLNAESEQNLFTIARAHNGTYRRIEVPKAAGRK